MILPLTLVPSADDLPHPVIQLPMKFKLIDEVVGCTMHVISCGICGKPTAISQREYDADVIPVCDDCEARAAELSG